MIQSPESEIPRYSILKNAEKKTNMKNCPLKDFEKLFFTAAVFCLAVIINLEKVANRNFFSWQEYKRGKGERKL